MGYQQAAQIIGSLGLKPTVAIDNTELPPLQSLQDLQELHAQGLEELETQGYSRAYQQAVKAYAMGLDSTLPDLEIAGTGIGKTMAQINDEAAAAISRSQQFLRADQLDPRLEGVVVNGRNITDIPVDELRDNLSVLLLESPEHERGPIMNAIAALDNSPHASMGMGIEWELPDPGLTIEANAATYEQGADFYQDWRNGGMNPDSGLDGLHIRPSVVQGDPIFSGVVEMSGSGGQYDRASDWALDAAIAQAAGGGDDDE